MSLTVNFEMLVTVPIFLLILIRLWGGSARWNAAGLSRHRI